MLRSMLLDRISLVMPAVEKKSKEPLFSSIWISGRQLRATNGRLFIRADLEEDSGVSMQVPGHLFQQVVKSASGNAIQLSQEDGNLIVKGDGTHVEILSNKTPSLISMNEVFTEPPNSEWEDIPSGFLEALSLCRASCSSDDALHVLTGVFVNKSNVWSCDRFRISRCKIDDSAKCTLSAIIPTDLIAETEKHEANVESMCRIGDSIALKFYDGKLVIAGGLILGTYPDLTYKLVDLTGKEEVQFPGDFSKALKLHNVMLRDTQEADRRVVVKFTEYGVSLLSESHDTGKAERKVRFEVPEGMKNVSFSCNPTHFAKVVSKHKNMVYSPEDHVMVFVGDKFVHQIKTTIVE